MTGLAELLGGETEPGVYRWDDDTPVADVGRACTAAGWRFGAIDTRAHPGRRGLLREVGRALDFPEWYGENFDALADCLADVVAPTVLLWDGWGALARDDPQSYVIGVDVLGARASGGAGFVVLLRGEGPDVDPPWPGA